MKKKPTMMPTMSRKMQIVPSTLDEKNRTVTISLGSGVRVLRSDFWSGDQYYEELSMDPAHVRMGRLQSGSAPLCKDHNSYSLDGMLGVIRTARIENGEILIDSQFSSRPEVEPIYQDVVAGIIQNASAGYRVYKMLDVTLPDEKIRVLRAVDWEPFEGSLVAVQADAGAGVRNQNQQVFPCEIINPTRAESALGDTMPPEIDTAAPAAQPVVAQSPVQAPAVAPAPVAVASDTGVRAAMEAERSRALEITRSCRKAGLTENVAEELIAKGVSIDEARAVIIDSLATRTESNNIRPVVSGGTPSNQEARLRSASVALLHRFDPSKYKLEGDAGNFRGLTMMEMVRSFLEASGKTTMGLSKMELAKRAFEGTSDFASLLANVANKTLRDSYEAAPQTFRPISKLNMAADFKQMSRVQLSDAPSLAIVGASGEVKHGALTDGKEVYSLATYANIVAINRQALINDDTSAFTRIPALMGRAAADLESDTVWNLLIANAAMNDGVALFHATHLNYTGTGTAISPTSLGVGRAKMKSQKNLQSRPMNVQPKFLICEPNTETLAEQALGPIVPNASSSFNPFSGKYTILSEPRLTVASGAQPWYLSAEPGQIDVIELSYLEGQAGAYMESRQGFDVEGIEIKCRLDFAAKVLDHRGLYKNIGV